MCKMWCWQKKNVYFMVCVNILNCCCPVFRIELFCSTSVTLEFTCIYRCHISRSRSEWLQAGSGMRDILGFSCYIFVHLFWILHAHSTQNTPSNLKDWRDECIRLCLICNSDRLVKVHLLLIYFWVKVFHIGERPFKNVEFKRNLHLLSKKTHLDTLGFFKIKSFLVVFK